MYFNKLILLIFITMNSLAAQHKVTKVDLNKYSGKWYVIACIPTKFDKTWNYVTESYTINKKGTIDIYTTYKKGNDPKEHSVSSKGFPISETNNINWKVQFVWPFKADYLIEELAEDYTYVVVGHPKKKFLYIMNRTGKMGDIQLREIINRCREKGYDVSQMNKIAQGF